MKIVKASQFKKDVKRSIKRHQNQENLKEVLSILQSGRKLPDKYHDHKLQGTDYRECHIEPNWLLIYKIEADALYLVGTGSHSDLFG